MGRYIEDIRSPKVRLAAEQVLDELQDEEYIEAYVSHTSAGTCSIKFELEALGTLRIANCSISDPKYIPRWNIYFEANTPQEISRKTYWYSGAEIEAAIKHIKSYAASILKNSSIVADPGVNVAYTRTLADIMAEKKQEASPYNNLSEDVVDMYQDDSDYLAYLNSQAGGKK